MANPTPKTNPKNKPVSNPIPTITPTPTVSVEAKPGTVSPTQKLQMEKSKALTEKYAPNVDKRNVKYPEFKIEICRGAHALTVERAKELLGWQTEGEWIAFLKTQDPDLNDDAISWKEDCFLTDEVGNRVKLHNNVKNRPWSKITTMGYVNDILKNHWQFNGETIIIGTTGRILSGQHRLIALVLAEQKRTKADEAAHWATYRDKPCTIDCTIAYGVSEDPKVTRTIDNVKTRTLADVIYADTTLFSGTTDEQRKSIARYLDYAVRLLWERTQEKDDAWTPRKTIAESLTYVDNHKKLLECVAFIQEEDKSDGISKVIYPGHASALMYLMSCSTTNIENVGLYEKKFKDVPYQSDESMLDWNAMRTARQFWSDIAKGALNIQPMFKVRRPIMGDSPNNNEWSGYVLGEGSESDKNEKLGVIIKAWNYYVTDTPFTPIDLELAYVTTTTEHPVYILKEFPTVRGKEDNLTIDLGPKIKEEKKSKEPKPDADPDNPNQPNDEITDDSGNVVSKIVEGPKDALSITKMYDDDKKTFGKDHILVYVKPSGNLVLYKDDAKVMGPLMGHNVRVHPTLHVEMVVVGTNDMDELGTKAYANGYKVMMITMMMDNKRDVTPWIPGESDEEDMTEGEGAYVEMNDTGDDDADPFPEGEGEAAIQPESEPTPTPTQVVNQPMANPKKVIVRKK